MDTASAGRALAAQRRIKPGVCVRCGTPFEAIGTRKFCSNGCRVKAGYQANVEKRRAARRERYRLQKESQP